MNEKENEGHIAKENFAAIAKMHKNMKFILFKITKEKKNHRKY